MKKIIYIFALLLTITACKKNIVPKPDKFLDEKQMENLLYDLAVLESMKVSQAPKLDSLQFNPQQFIYKNTQSTVFRWHKIWCTTLLFLKNTIPL